MTSDATIARMRREMAAKSIALPVAGLEGAPILRAQKAEARRLLDAQQAEINSLDTTIRKYRAVFERCQSRHAAVVAADCEGRAAKSSTAAEAEAWLEGAAYFRGERLYEIPGAIVVLCREMGVSHLPTLPALDAQLAQASADLAVAEARLQSAVETWDASNVSVASAAVVATATVRNNATSVATLPAVLSDIEAIVRER